ncbi:hypothetical protein [Deinococcus sp. QL22]|uniref:hypothetical protein n=1 Tax=Deinococcus sp. QL22 TaxID=2939437 RepID=UPI0020171E3D|nr:hypothetical protein [Deinococcus sp. QL22]UQN09268.1 hypothetical protein M1R55_22085 [Deinococcus sp. QL22]
MEFQVGAQSVAALAGTPVFLPQMIPHTWRVVGNAPAKTLLSVFPGGAEAMEQELSDLPAAPPTWSRWLRFAPGTA